MITSLIEMLELPNFGHIPHLRYNLSHVIFVDVMDISYDIITFISKDLYFQKT